MEQMMQPRSNSRSLPTLDIREGVIIRRVEEAYPISEDNNKTFDKQSLILYVVWLVCVAALIVWAVMTYPPTMLLLIIELLTGVVITAGLFFIKEKKL